MNVLGQAGQTMTILCGNVIVRVLQMAAWFKITKSKTFPQAQYKLDNI